MSLFNDSLLVIGLPFFQFRDMLMGKVTDSVAEGSHAVEIEDVVQGFGLRFGGFMNAIALVGGEIQKSLLCQNGQRVIDGGAAYPQLPCHVGKNQPLPPGEFAVDYHFPNSVVDFLR